MAVPGIPNEFPTAAVITAASAILVWVLAKLYELLQAWLEKKAANKKYVIALFAEIDFNTKDMEIFLAESASVSAVVEKVRSDRSFIPHITDARHTDIYKGNLTNIAFVGNGLLGQLVYFYGLLEKLKNQVDGVYKPSFGLISPAGREAVIVEIVSTAADSAHVGRRLLSTIQAEYPLYRLERNPRENAAYNASLDDLKKRLGRLKSDLDRVDSDHRQSPKH